MPWSDHEKPKTRRRRFPFRSLANGRRFCAIPILSPFAPVSLPRTPSGMPPWQHSACPPLSPLDQGRDQDRDRRPFSGDIVKSGAGGKRHTRYWRIMSHVLTAIADDQRLPGLLHAVRRLLDPDGGRLLKVTSAQGCLSPGRRGDQASRSFGPSSVSAAHPADRLRTLDTSRKRSSSAEGGAATTCRDHRPGAVVARARQQSGLCLGILRAEGLGGLAAWAGFTPPSAVLMLASPCRAGNGWLEAWAPACSTGSKTRWRWLHRRPLPCSGRLRRIAGIAFGDAAAGECCFGSSPVRNPWIAIAAGARRPLFSTARRYWRKTELIAVRMPKAASAAAAGLFFCSRFLPSSPCPL